MLPRNINIKSSKNVYTRIQLGLTWVWSPADAHDSQLPLHGRTTWEWSRDLGKYTFPVLARGILNQWAWNELPTWVLMFFMVILLHSQIWESVGNEGTMNHEDSVLIWLTLDCPLQLCTPLLASVHNLQHQWAASLASLRSLPESATLLGRLKVNANS